MEFRQRFGWLMGLLMVTLLVLMLSASQQTDPYHAEFQWVVEPTLGSYTRFVFSARGSSSGARYEAVIHGWGRTARHDGSLRIEEWRGFLEDAERHGAWYLQNGVQGLVAEAADFRLRIRSGDSRHAARFHGLPTAAHERFRAWILTTIVGTEEQSLKASVREAR